jgi:hypothetical protein
MIHKINSQPNTPEGRAFKFNLKALNKIFSNKETRSFFFEAVLIFLVKNIRGCEIDQIKVNAFDFGTSKYICTVKEGSSLVLSAFDIGSAVRDFINRFSKKFLF